MAITSGFYNAVNNDRLYGSEDFAALLDGIITNGVYANVGEALKVTHSNGRTFNIGSGRAWANGFWLRNSANATVDINQGGTQPRYDSIIIEIDNRVSVRRGRITVKGGTPDSAPIPPEMTNTSDMWQLPLANIYVPSGATELSNSNITDRRGTSACPWVTGPLQTFTSDDLTAQWAEEWRARVLAMDAELLQLRSQQDGNMTSWRATLENEFRTWFNGLKNNLNGNQVTLLKHLIDQAALLETQRHLGAVSSTVLIEGEGDLRTITETDDDATTVTTFITEGETKVIRSEITPKSGAQKWIRTTTIIPTGNGKRITNQVEVVSK